MSVSKALSWWRESAHLFGPQVMDGNGQSESDWTEIVANSRIELQHMLKRTRMRSGEGLSVLEVGCGTGRLAAALAESFGFVLGIDVSRHLLEVACARNQNERVVFELADGRRLRPASRRAFDAVFSYDVFHYIDRLALRDYFDDIYWLLKPGGQFVFESNCCPIRLGTRLETVVRHILFWLGKDSWRHQPTDPGYRRKLHPVDFLRRSLTEVGFQVDRLVDDDPRDTWIVATKPADS